MSLIIRPLLLAALLVPTAPLSAQDAATGPMRTLARCRLITEPTARLACFDAAAAQLQDAVSTGQVTMLDREGVRQTKRSLFGFTLPRVGLFGRSDGEPEFTEIDTTIARVLPLGFGKYELMLKDGARWQTTDALASPPRSGSAVRIRKATLGSYFINVNGRRGVKGRRIG